MDEVGDWEREFAEELTAEEELARSCDMRNVQLTNRDVVLHAYSNNSIRM